MSDYRVELEAYSGPLDLLLFLVKKHEIDLHDIPIAKLTEQYLHYLDQIRQVHNLDLELAAEFLVMASTLLEIKSAMIAPRPESEDDAETSDPTADTDLSDPRYELVRQLLEYKKYKDAADALDHRLDDWHNRFANRPARGTNSARTKTNSEDSATTDANAQTDDDIIDPDDIDNAADPIDLDMDDVSVLDLCEAFARMLESVGQKPYTHDVVYDDTPIALHAEDIVDQLQRAIASAANGSDGSTSLTLAKIFEGRQNRSEMIGLFLATLELVRQHRVRVFQAQTAQGDQEIRLDLREQNNNADDNDPMLEDDTEHDWRDPETGEIQYEWPSEEIRKRVEKRTANRLNRFKSGRPETAGEKAASTNTADNEYDDDPVIDLDDE